MSQHERFCIWLEGYLDAIDINEDDAILTEIRNKLRVALGTSKIGPTTEDMLKFLKNRSDEFNKQAIGGQIRQQRREDFAVSQFDTHHESQLREG